MRVECLHGARVERLLGLIAHRGTYFDLVGRSHPLHGVGESLLALHRMGILIQVGVFTQLGRCLARIRALIRVRFIRHRLHRLSIRPRVVINGAVLEQRAHGRLGLVRVFVACSL